MKKILENIENTWYKTSVLSIRSSCRSHVRNNNGWRYVVSSHNMNGVETGVYNWGVITNRC